MAAILKTKHVFPRAPRTNSKDNEQLLPVALKNQWLIKKLKNVYGDTAEAVIVLRRLTTAAIVPFVTKQMIFFFSVTVSTVHLGRACFQDGIS